MHEIKERVSPAQGAQRETSQEIQDKYNTILKKHARGQCGTVLRHLMTRGAITQRQAVREYEMYRLGARIKDLRDEGVRIKTTLVKSEAGGQYARYELEEERDD